MWTLHLNQRFSDTDALGHINNANLPRWFEEAREPLFRLFSPDLDIHDWHLILARIDVDFIGELFYGREVEIRTVVSKIGNSSMTLHHEAWQDGKLAAKGNAVMVHFDLKTKQSKTIPEPIRQQLQQHLVTA